MDLNTIAAVVSALVAILAVVEGYTWPKAIRTAVEHFGKLYFPDRHVRLVNSVWRGKRLSVKVSVSGPGGGFYVLRINRRGDIFEWFPLRRKAQVTKQQAAKQPVGRQPNHARQKPRPTRPEAGRKSRGTRRSR